MFQEEEIHQKLRLIKSSGAPKRKEDIRKVRTIHGGRDPTVKATKTEEIEYFSKNPNSTRNRKTTATKCSIGYPILNQTVKGTEKG